MARKKRKTTKRQAAPKRPGRPPTGDSCHLRQPKVSMELKRAIVTMCAREGLTQPQVLRRLLESHPDVKKEIKRNSVALEALKK